MTNLITTTEAAARLGVIPRRVRALAEHRADFPRPAMRAANVLLWDADEIDRWNATADRTPGRPIQSTGRER